MCELYHRLGLTSFYMCSGDHHKDQTENVVRNIVERGPGYGEPIIVGSTYDVTEKDCLFTS